MRKYTNILLELVDQEVVERQWLIEALTQYLSEDEVRDFMSRNFDFEQLSELLGEELV